MTASAPHDKVPGATIRPARSGDLASILDIVERAYSLYVPRIGRRPAPMDDHYAERVRRHELFVAEDDGVVGAVVLISASDHVLVDNVAVDPDHQHRGIGRALLAYAEAHATALGMSELRLCTNVAMTENLELYPRLGWTETGRRNEDGFDRVFFRRPIAKPDEPRGA